MRLFIAIDLPRSFKAELARIEKEVKGISCGGRFVPQDNFHITLHFIGESDDIAGAAEAMHEAHTPLYAAPWQIYKPGEGQPRPHRRNGGAGRSWRAYRHARVP